MSAKSFKEKDAAIILELEEAATGQTLEAMEGYYVEIASKLNRQ